MIYLYAICIITFIVILFVYHIIQKKHSCSDKIEAFTNRNIDINIANMYINDNNRNTLIIKKHDKSLKRALQRSGSSSIYKKPSYYKEEEQLDELSKDTLSMYVKKAHYSGGMADFKHGRIADKRGDSKDKMKLSKISRNRERGINKAVDRLTKKD